VSACVGTVTPGYLVASASGLIGFPVSLSTGVGKILEEDLLPPFGTLPR
jgi:hypothetical protein